VLAVGGGRLSGFVDLRRLKRGLKMGGMGMRERRMIGNCNGIFGVAGGSIVVQCQLDREWFDGRTLFDHSTEIVMA
jgi:hypothetical protein